MYIFEGRGKGATWSLLLEALHNQGVFVTTQPTKITQDIKENLLQKMCEQKAVSLDGAEYLRNNIFTVEEWKKQRIVKEEKKVYLDVSLKLLNDVLIEELGVLPEVTALGNDDLQIVQPRQIKELKNTFIQDQREYFGRDKND